MRSPTLESVRGLHLSVSHTYRCFDTTSVVKVKTPILPPDDGDGWSDFKPDNLEPGEPYRIALLRTSMPREGKWGPYIVAEVIDEDGDGDEHIIPVSAHYKAPGFLDDGQLTEFDEACQKKLGEQPDRSANGRLLVDCFYEAPTDDPDTRLTRYTSETDDGREYSTYYFGVPEEEEKGGGGASSGIEWRD